MADRTGGPGTRRGGQPACQVRVMRGRGVGLGPGKASLLRAIGETRSISAAGRRLRMSYRRAWLRGEGMNALCGSPLVVTRRGGAAGGGAEVTPLGRRVLAAYDELQALAAGSRAFRYLARQMRAGAAP